MPSNLLLRCSRLFPLLTAILAANPLSAANATSMQVNAFGHLELTASRPEHEVNSSFSVGEHSLFVNSSLNERFSYLGEFVVRFNTAGSNYSASIERSLVKYAYSNNHSVIFGKVHSPVNYWNDSYHHGRLFFPVIDRPTAFSYLIPLHTLGLQLQGQNIGAQKWGYDFMFGNGIDSTDALQEGHSPAAMLAVHAKPVEGMRIGASYFYDRLETNTPGAHAGHGIAPGFQRANAYKGPVNFHLACVSAAWFGKEHEFLNEFVYNAAQTELAGKADNYANFTYAGWRLRDHWVAYGLADYLRTADNDLHTYPFKRMKFALGLRHEFNHLLNVKVQLEHTTEHHAHLHMGKVAYWHVDRVPGLRVQVAYGF